MDRSKEWKKEFWDMFSPLCIKVTNSENNCKFISKGYYDALNSFDLSVIKEVFLQSVMNDTFQRGLPDASDYRIRCMQIVNKHKQEKEIKHTEPIGHRERRAKAEMDFLNTCIEVHNEKGHDTELEKCGFSNLAQCFGLVAVHKKKKWKEFEEKELKKQRV